MQPTMALARAAGIDAGNRSMRAEAGPRGMTRIATLQLQHGKASRNW